jgi:formylglycine-generating enzyme required for sulfatase activity
MTKKYALVIGNNQHHDLNWHDLKTPECDAEAMAAVLKDPTIGGFDRVTPLLNASVAEMRREIYQLFAPNSHQPDDLLLLYFSGHGELDSHNRLYFIAKETEHALVEATGLDADYVTRLMDDARSRQQVVILDCCYSGAFGLPKGGVPTEEIFKGNSQAIFERAETLLEDAHNGYGRHILAASEALQLAWEGNAWQGQVENSFFTTFLVEGLTKGLADRNNDGLIDIDELYDHIREGMRLARQTPIKRSLYANGKLIIARSPISPFERKQEQLTDLLAQAEQSSGRGDYSRAELLLNKVIEAGETDDLLTDTAQAMLADLKIERARAGAYHKVKSLLHKGATQAARLAWQRFTQYYPDYDPERLAAQLTSSPAPQNLSPAGEKRQNLPPAGGRGGANTQPVPNILPPPFAWVKIPAGQVTIEKQPLKVDPFFMAKYPLTNAQFKPFIEAGGYQEKKWWTEAGWQVCQKEKWAQPRYWQDDQWNGAEQPVVGVSWFEAVAYCRWLSHHSGQKIMLPTEAQWQVAAQGDDGRNHPWGNKWDCQRCNNSVKPCSSQATTPVTRYEGKGDSPFGIVDMAGNVWEWCLTEYKSGHTDLDGTNVRVLRGGSWRNDGTDFFRVYARSRLYPDYWLNYGGFRLALSL